MPLIEVLVTGIGTAVARAVLKMWLKDTAIGEAAATSIVDILKSKLDDVIKRGAAQREFEKIRDRSAISFQQLLVKDDSQLDETDVEFIANAAAELIVNTDFTPELLARNNLDPDELTEFFLSRSGAQGGNPYLADSANPARSELYRRLLLHACQQIVDISSQLPHFSERVFAELLQRENRIFDVAQQVLDRVDLLVAAQKGDDPLGERFETTYRLALARRFDHLELFGVDLSDRSNKRYNLSVAYVTLEVEETTFNDAASEADIDGLREPIPADQALLQTDRLLVRGAAGSGKTTLLQWVAVYCAGRKHKDKLAAFNDLVPFVIRLRDFDDRDLPRPSEFARVVAPTIDGEPDGWSHRILNSGRAAVLIDGLDEAAENRRERVREWLQDLLLQYPKVRYLVTTRPYAVEEGWLDADKFLDATLQEMTTDDVARFVRHWHQAVATGLDDEEEREKLEKLGDTLIDELKRNPDLAKLAASPLLCAMISRCTAIAYRPCQMTESSYIVRASTCSSDAMKNAEFRCAITCS